MSRLAAVAMAVVAALSGPVAGDAQTSSPGAERFVVSGIVTVEGGRELAWLQEPTLTRNQVIVARTGDRIGPYRVTKILADRVELEGPDGTTLVPLYNASRPETPAATASLARTERLAARAAQAERAPTDETAGVEAVDPDRTRRAWARRGNGASPNAAAEPRNPAARADRRAADRSPEARARESGASSAGTAGAPGPATIVIPPGDPRQRFTGFGR